MSEPTTRVPEPATVLVLWDVDHTLLAARGAGRNIYELAFAEVFGRPLLAIADMAGRTERAIIADTLALHGIHGAESHEEFFAALGAAAHGMRDQLRARGTALPGAAAALRALAARGVVQSVVTGNVRAVADAKLGAFELADLLDLDIGGYGDEHADRAVLVRAAIDRAAAKYARAFSAARTVVIGDTPHDVKGALDNGALAVGVATGGSDSAALAAAGAHLVLPDLSDTAALCRFIDAVY